MLQTFYRAERITIGLRTVYKLNGMHAGRILHRKCLTANYLIYVPFLCQQAPLYIAAREGHDETVKFLVEKGANINNNDVDGVSVTTLLMVD